MRQQTSLYVPTPCHEDWNKMTATEQGRFCSSCCKQVVDFTLMSDQQVLNYLSNQSGKLCGRFDADQLQRPLIETKMSKKKSWWMALTMPLLFLSERSEARVNSAVPADTAISPIDKLPEIMGKLAFPGISKITVEGIIVDEDNKPIPFATINQKGTKNQVASDDQGNFSIQIPTDDSVAVLTADCVGFVPTEKLIHLSNKDVENIIIKLEPAQAVAGEIVVLGYAIRRKEVWPFDTMKTAVKKFFKIQEFKVYPNPVIKGTTIHLEMQKPGEYQLQLLDSRSKLIRVEEINAVSEKTTTPIQLPSAIASGVYYVRLIDEQKKKQYTEKLIIE